MKRTSIVLGILGSFVAVVAMATEIGAKSFNLIAPIVYGVGNAPDQVGSLIFDANTNAFYGKGSSSAGVWQTLTNDVTTQIPPGTIIAYGGTTAPAGWVLCDGASYSATTEAALAAVLWDTTNSKYAYGGTGTFPSGTFNVPDMRGRFLRGVDSGAGRDPDAAGRTVSATGGNTGDAVGSIQGDQFRSHTHNYDSALVGAGVAGVGSRTGASNNIATSASGGNETRPLNVYVNYIIKK